MRRRCLLVAATAVWVSGCASRHEPQSAPHAAPATGAFSSGGTHADAGTAAPANWWRLYDDDVLTGLVAQALDANADLKVAVANLQLAQAVAQEARAGRYPSTQFGAGVVHGRNLIADSLAASSHRTAQDLTTRLAGIDVSYELDLSERIGYGIAAAQADAQAVEAARDALRVVVAAETTRAYMTARSAGHELEIASRSVEIAAASVEILRRQAAAGAASRFDVERTQILLEQARAQLPLHAGRRQAAMFELAALVGRSPGDVPAMPMPVRSPPGLPLPLPVGDAQLLLARRPDVRLAQRRLAAATARTGVAEASLYPRINLGFNAGLNENALLQGHNAVTLGFGPLLSWTFPNQAIARARIAQSDAAAAAALAAFDGTVLRALKEVEQALTAWTSERQRHEAFAAAEAHASEAHRLSLSRGAHGALSRLDLLAAEQTLLTSRGALAASDSRLVDAEVSLFRALGGGWAR